VVQLSKFLGLLEPRGAILEQRRRPPVISEDGVAELVRQRCSQLFSVRRCPVGRLESERLPGGLKR